MLVGPVHQEEVWSRSSQREPARSNIHTSLTALRAGRTRRSVGSTFEPMHCSSNLPEIAANTVAQQFQRCPPIAVISRISVFDRYGPAVRCKKISSNWRRRSCINVSGL